MRFTSVRNVLSASAVTLLLLGAPLQLAAQERESPAGPRAAVVEWATGIWSDLIAFFMGGCAVDPNGCPVRPTAEIDGGCAVDPNGGCGR
jgi:hypothetical protein